MKAALCRDFFTMPKLISKRSWYGDTISVWRQKAFEHALMVVGAEKKTGVVRNELNWTNFNECCE